MEQFSGEGHLRGSALAVGHQSVLQSVTVEDELLAWLQGQGHAGEFLCGKNPQQAADRVYLAALSLRRHVDGVRVASA